MGANTDAAGMGFLFRPSPGPLAQLIYEFDPRGAVDDAQPDFPASPDFELVNWATSSDSSTRLDFSDVFAARFPRIWGFASSIEGSKGAENTDTGYRIEVVCRFPYRIKDFGCGAAEQSWFFAKVRRYSSNSLICDPVPIHLGSIVAGLMAACYTGNGRAYLDSRYVVKDVLLPPHFHFLPTDFWGCSYILAEWKEFTPDTLLRPSDFNFDEWVNDWLPTLGGRPYAAQEPVENRITGVRIVPPPRGPKHLPTDQAR